MSTPPSARFYVDENLDGRFADVLEAGGVDVVRCRELNLRAVPDAVWIPRVTRLGLIIVTGDRLIRYRTVEREALRASRSRVLFIRVGDARHDELGRIFVDSHSIVQRFAAIHDAPWLVTLGRPPAFGHPGRIHRLDLGE